MVVGLSAIIDEVAGAVTVRLAGRGTVASVAGTRAVLLEALERGADVTVDVSALERADLSILQLILSARRMADARGIECIVSGDLTPLRAASGDPERFDELLRTG